MNYVETIGISVQFSVTRTVEGFATSGLKAKTHSLFNRSLAVAITLGAMSSASAHELMLKPPTSIPSSATSVAIEVSNGDIDTSSSNTSLAAIEDLRIVRNGVIVKPTAQEWVTQRLTSYFSIDVRPSATYLLGLSTVPKAIQMTREEFADYLKEEQIEVSAGSQTGKKVRERYSKHAISYLQVGPVLTDDYAAALTYPAQIRLTANPSSLQVGDKVRVIVTLNGKPLASQLLLGGRKDPGRSSAVSPTLDLKLRTDDRGMAEFVITRAGRWYVYFVAMRPVNDGTADYESFYATTLFDIKP